MFFRKILLDEYGDKLQKNNTLIKRKEEATSTAREEIKLQTAREMQLAGEVERVLTALPDTQVKLRLTKTDRKGQRKRRRR